MNWSVAGIVFGAAILLIWYLKLMALVDEVVVRKWGVGMAWTVLWVELALMFAITAGVCAGHIAK